MTRTMHGLPGVYNASALSLADGEGVALAVDAQGVLFSDPYTLTAGEDLTNNVMRVEGQFTYQNITLAAPTTTTVKSGAGLLHVIRFTAAANGVITIYDNIAGSGTLIGTITSPATLLNSHECLVFDVNFGTGLTIVTSGAAQDVTVSYR